MKTSDRRDKFLEEERVVILDDAFYYIDGDSGLVVWKNGLTRRIPFKDDHSDATLAAHHGNVFLSEERFGSGVRLNQVLEDGTLKPLSIPGPGSQLSSSFFSYQGKLFIEDRQKKTFEIKPDGSLKETSFPSNGQYFTHSIVETDNDAYGYFFGKGKKFISRVQAKLHPLLGGDESGLVNQLIPFGERVMVVEDPGDEGRLWAIAAGKLIAVNKPEALRIHSAVFFNNEFSLWTTKALCGEEGWRKQETPTATTRKKWFSTRFPTALR